MAKVRHVYAVRIAGRDRGFGGSRTITLFVIAAAASEAIRKGARAGRKRLINAKFTGLDWLGRAI